MIFLRADKVWIVRSSIKKLFKKKCNKHIKNNKESNLELQNSNKKSEEKK